MAHQFVISDLLQQQVDEYRERSGRAGSLARFEEAYSSLMRRMTAKPHNEGNFLYWLPTGRPVYVIAEAPLAMNYAVYEAEKLVWVTKVTMLGSDE